MKKVCYALGAAGALPAIGMMMPAAAAGTAHAQETTAKKVSLQHRSAAAAGCTGSVEARASNMSVKLEFWHTYHPAYDTSCIGTVDTSFFATLHSYDSEFDRVRIYAHHLNGTKYEAYSRLTSAHIRDQHLFAVGVHRSFAYPPIQVCTAAVYGNGNVFQGPVCRSVG